MDDPPFEEGEKLTTRDKGEALAGVTMRSRANDLDGVLILRCAEEGVAGAGDAGVDRGELGAVAARAGLLGLLFSCIEGSSDDDSGSEAGNAASMGEGTWSSETASAWDAGIDELEASSLLKTLSARDIDGLEELARAMDLREASFCTAAGEDAR